VAETIAPEKMAVIILDMAKGYGWLPGSFGYEMVAQVRKLKDAAYAAGVQVLHVHSLRRKTDHIREQRMFPDTSDLDVIPELQPVDKDIIVYKRYLSGFSHNDLDYTLRTMGIELVIIAGASTDNTVLWTSADALQNHYSVVVVEDCTIVHRQNEAPGAKEGALRIIRSVLRGDVLPLDGVVEKYLKPLKV
jgi:nicotinamidase-related amidase